MRSTGEVRTPFHLAHADGFISHSRGSTESPTAAPDTHFHFNPHMDERRSSVPRSSRATSAVTFLITQKDERGVRGVRPDFQMWKLYFCKGHAWNLRRLLSDSVVSKRLSVSAADRLPNCEFRAEKRGTGPAGGGSA